jgi:aminopeptidase N
LTLIAITIRREKSNSNMRGTQSKEFKRLPTNVVPINYAITLKPNLKSFTFSGTETISVKVNEETKQILLNANELEISSASFAPQNGQSITSFIYETKTCLSKKN